jgi:hypothetical protein
MEGKPGDMREIERSVVKLRGKAALWREGSAITRTEEGYAMRLGVAERPRFRASMNLGLADDMGLIALGQINFPTNLGRRRWGSTLRLGLSNEISALGFKAAPVWDHRFVPEVRVGVSVPAIRFFDENGEHDKYRHFVSGIASIGYAGATTRMGRLDFGLTQRWVSEKGFLPEPAEDPGQDLAFEVAWQGDLQDDPRIPQRGGAWLFAVAAPVAGDDRPWTAFADLAATARLGKTGRFTVSILGRAQATGDEEVLPVDRWSEAGTWWEAPGFDAGRARAQEYYRGTLVLRRKIGAFFGSTVTAGLSGAAWSLSDNRVDQFIDDNGTGVALFVEASTVRLGPLTIGVMHSEVRGNRIFVTLNPERIAWPGPSYSREAKFIP